MNEELAKIMEQNLALVWNEKDSTKRLDNLKQLYTEDCVLIEFGETIKGYDAINTAVEHVQKSMPANFIFTKQKNPSINLDMGRLSWGAAPSGEQPTTLGMDVAIFENNKIKSLHVFIEA